jgi:DNA polymerase/3'-5' exonuclease PolX
VQTSAIAKRANSRDQFTWGPQNKLAVDVQSGVPVDFFATSEQCWHNYLVCRTGPAQLNTRIARLARERGLHWHPYGKGFTRLDNPSEWITITDERQVFQVVGLPYLEPEAR